MKQVYAFFRAIVGGFIANNCQIHAAGLTYFSIMAVLPMICSILIVARACNLDEYARKFIDDRIDAFVVNIETGQDNDLAKHSMLFTCDLEQRKAVAVDLAKQMRQFSHHLFERVDQINFGTLGWIGLGVLLWMAISALCTVEMSFNEIWEVTKGRSLLRRILLYLFIILILPIMTGVVMSLPVMQLVMRLDSRLAGYAFAVATMSFSLGFILWVMPNRKIKFMNAWLGGLVTGFMLAGWLRVCAIAQVGIARTSMLYGSFSLVPIILAWSYMSWQIVLLGANFVKVIETKAWKGEKK